MHLGRVLLDEVGSDDLAVGDLAIIINAILLCWLLEGTPVISVCDLIEYVTGVHVVPKARCGC